MVNRPFCNPGNLYISERVRGVNSLLMFLNGIKQFWACARHCGRYSGGELSINHQSQAGDQNTTIGRDSQKQKAPGTRNKIASCWDEKGEKRVSGFGLVGVRLCWAP